MIRRNLFAGPHHLLTDTTGSNQGEFPRLRKKETSD